MRPMAFYPIFMHKRTQIDSLCSYGKNVREATDPPHHLSRGGNLQPSVGHDWPPAHRHEWRKGGTLHRTIYHSYALQLCIGLVGIPGVCLWGGLEAI